MSIMCCQDCGILLCTDDAPEVFREEFNDTVLCEFCYEERIAFLMEARNGT